MTATAFSTAPRPPAPRPPLSRNAVIALVVVGLHIGFIWALQSGLLMRAAEIVVPGGNPDAIHRSARPKVEPVTARAAYTDRAEKRPWPKRP